ncbi:hypothetical protein Acr_15g0014430 [Actinidia rufa]|uniref:Protein TIC 214 n=1 Tax=Actinidia rufa TaxID=165716 RepID=A0A7J0FVX7_9ERIC|nr:hypothetical protein Acr_15g0014430 [Actinidia rufa]
MQEGSEKKVSATTGFIMGQLVTFISIYYVPLHLVLGRHARDTLGDMQGNPSLERSQRGKKAMSPTKVDIVAIPCRLFVGREKNDIAFHSPTISAQLRLSLIRQPCPPMRSSASPLIQPQGLILGIAEPCQPPTYAPLRRPGGLHMHHVSWPPPATTTILITLHCHPSHYLKFPKVSSPSPPAVSGRVGTDMGCWSMNCCTYSGGEKKNKEAIFGVVLRFNIVTWCLHEKGPLFVALFKPLGMVIAVIAGLVFLDDTLHLGRLSVFRKIALQVSFSLTTPPHFDILKQNEGEDICSILQCF